MGNLLVRCVRLNISTRTTCLHIGRNVRQRTEPLVSTVIGMELITKCKLMTRILSPITGLGRGELSARVVLVLFCVCFGGLLWPHSGEGPPIAERVIFGVVRFVRLNQGLRTKTR
jgi:hypothetical protein